MMKRKLKSTIGITLSAALIFSLCSTPLQAGAASLDPAEEIVAVEQEEEIVTAADGAEIVETEEIAVQADEAIAAADDFDEAEKAELKGDYGKDKDIRTIVTTDGEGDDMCSFIRMMLYTNEMDIEGIVLTSSRFHHAGGTVYTNPEQTETKEVEPSAWAGNDWINNYLNLYEEAYPNLQAHADYAGLSEYPSPDYLRYVNKLGNVKDVGEMYEDSEGSDLIKAIMLDNDPRPVHIQTWGGANSAARALLSIENQYKGTAQWNEIYKKVCDKTTMYFVMDQDGTYENYIAKEWPDINIIHDADTWWCFAYGWDRTSPLTANLSNNWFTENIVNNHGSLMAAYNNGRGSFMSEGDSPSYMYLIDTGLRSSEDPSYGGWAGRFEKLRDRFYDNAKDVNPLKVGTEVEIMNGPTGTGEYELYTADNHYTLERWIEDFQNDFAARADWCVETPETANHRPTLTVAGGVDIEAAAGEPVSLKISAADPDGNKVSFKSYQYFEADTYDGASDGKIEISGADTAKPSFIIPADARIGDTIHIIVEGQDDAAAQMKHYQRVIVTVAEKKPDTPTTPTTPEENQNITSSQKNKNNIALNAYLKVNQKGNKLNVRWGKVKDADGYMVYIQYCNKKFSSKATKRVKSASTTQVAVTKLGGRKLNLKKNFKVYVAAYKLINGKKVVSGKSITAHFVGKKNTKYTNVKKVTVSKSRYTLKAGKTARIKAKTVVENKKKKELSNAHAKKFRYKSTNTSVAKVSASGKITAKGKGTCSIYVYARNGYAKKIKVTVK